MTYLGFRKPDGLTVPDGFSSKVPYTRAGEISFQENPSVSVSRQDSVRHARPKTDRLTTYDAMNVEAAAVILADIDAHGGPESLACRWAALWTMRHAPKQTQGVLFETEVA